jgi:hypothetical protein
MMSPWYRQIFPTRLAPHRHSSIAAAITIPSWHARVLEPS